MFIFSHNFVPSSLAESANCLSVRVFAFFPLLLLVSFAHHVRIESLVDALEKSSGESCFWYSLLTLADVDGLMLPTLTLWLWLGGNYLYQSACIKHFGCYLASGVWIWGRTCDCHSSTQMWSHHHRNDTWWFDWSDKSPPCSCVARHFTDLVPSVRPRGSSFRSVVARSSYMCRVSDSFFDVSIFIQT